MRGKRARSATHIVGSGFITAIRAAAESIAKAIVARVDLGQRHEATLAAIAVPNGPK